MGRKSVAVQQSLWVTTDAMAIRQIRHGTVRRAGLVDRTSRGPEEGSGTTTFKVQKRNRQVGTSQMKAYQNPETLPLGTTPKRASAVVDNNNF